MFCQAGRVTFCFVRPRVTISTPDCSLQIEVQRKVFAEIVFTDSRIARQYGISFHTNHGAGFFRTAEAPANQPLVGKKSGGVSASLGRLQTHLGSRSEFGGHQWSSRVTTISDSRS